MKTTLHIFITISFLTAVAFAGSEKTTLRSLWKSSKYSSKPVPKEWLPKTVPPTETKVSKFKEFSIPPSSISIPEFIARYGLPARYLVTKLEEGDNFLIYDLPSGHAVALYVGKPPVNIFKAVVIIDSEGELLKLIK